MSTCTVNRMLIGSVIAIAGGVALLGAMLLYLVAGPDGARESARQTDPVGATA
jgi:hypothetical protein